MAFAMTTTSFAPRTAALTTSTRFAKARVAAPRRISQLVRAEKSPVKDAEQTIKDAEQTITEVSAHARRQSVQSDGVYVFCCEFRLGFKFS
jgi:hypothetical protein